MFISPEKDGVFLPNDIGEECHKARALYCFGKCALPRRREVRAATRHDLAVRIQELLDRLDVLVVDLRYLGCVEIFFHKVC
jgi:hypothetical protein